MQPPIIITASEFKAKCLKLMDDVAETGGSVLITKHGKAIARLMPAREAMHKKDPFGALKDKTAICGDIISPLSDVRWRALSDDADSQS